VARAEAAPVPLHHKGTAMNFASIRVIANDVTRLAGFYAEITCGCRKPVPPGRMPADR
jgi:hypothetical protein